MDVPSLHSVPSVSYNYITMFLMLESSISENITQKYLESLLHTNWFVFYLPHTSIKHDYWKRKMAWRSRTSLAWIMKILKYFQREEEEEGKKTIALLHKFRNVKKKKKTSAQRSKRFFKTLWLEPLHFPITPMYKMTTIILTALIKFRTEMKQNQNIQWIHLF